MVAIAALSIGIPLARSVAQRRPWRVETRFEHTLWLRGEGDALCALTTCANPGPHRAVVVELPDWTAGTTVAARGRELHAGDALVTWSHIAEWDPRPRRFRLTGRERREAAAR